jgi:4-amino-4-deoxy-L-arabinose transferase-like glycosyltransferase
MTSWVGTTKVPFTPIAAEERAGADARLEALGLGGVLVLALALRLPHLTLVPHFTDETWEVLWSLPILRSQELLLTNFNTFKGSLFNYLVAGSFLLLGTTALAARLVALVAGALTVLASVALGRAWGPPRAGLLAAGLLAVNGAHILINSHIAWSNCITPLFTTLAIWTLYLAVSAAETGSRSGPLLVLSGLLWGLAFQTHPGVAVLLPGAAIYLLWKGRRLLRTIWPYLGLLAFVAGCANLVAYNLANGPESLLDAEHVRENYTTDQEAANSYPAALGWELLLLARVLGGAVDLREATWSYVADLPVLLGVVLAVAGLIHLARRGNPLPALLAVSCLVLLPAINPKFRTLVQSRYLMPLAPILFAATAALLMDRLRDPSRARRLAAFVAALVLLLGPLPPLARYYQQAFASGETNERALNLAARIAGVRGPTEPVVLDEAFGGEIGWGASEVRAMRYLLGLQDTPVRVIKITPKRVEDELADGSSVLVVLNGRQLRDFDRLPLDPLTPLPERGSEVGLFRLTERGQPKKATVPDCSGHCRTALAMPPALIFPSGDASGEPGLG